MDVKQDISTVMTVAAAVKPVLDRSCNDCHSNRTIWPWYSEIAPISWGVASDVSDGRRHMNLSEWGTYPDYKRKDLLDKACKLVTQHDMPPFTYLLAHRTAALSEPDRQALCRWTKQAGEDVAAEASAFRLPSIELRGDLTRIFAVTDCEYISGMTCRITYNGALPLPSEAFFEEFDESGRQAGPRVRLIYPHLESGEGGTATFRTRLSTPIKVALEGEWNGPWRDPY